MKKKYMRRFMLGVICGAFLSGCGSKKNDSSAFQINSNQTEAEINETDENMGIAYTVNEDGTYTCAGKNYKYKLVRTGRSNGAVCDCKYIVLTNHNDITFEDIAYSLINSNSQEDYLRGSLIIGMAALETDKTAVSGTNISEKEHKLKTLTAEDIQMLASKHEKLNIDDFSPYMDLSSLQENGSLSELLKFSYNGETMYMRISASDKDLAAAPYEGALDHAVIFRADFLELDTMEKEYNYDGSCADIRAGNLDHILNGTVAMDDYMTMDLPDGLSQSEFKHWLGSNGGVYFIKKGEEGNAGFENTGVFAEKPSAGGIEIWENGEIAEKTELIKEIEPVQMGDAVLKRGIFQTEQGINWYIAYTEIKDSHISYCLYLNSEEYTEEEFKKVSESIRMQEHAIY